MTRTASEKDAAGVSNGRRRTSSLPRNRQAIMNGTRSNRQKGLIKVKPAGESGRTGIHPLHFFRIIWNSASTLSKCVNVLWPVVPAAITIYYAVPEQNVLKFTLAYIAMVPCANLIGFAGQQLAKKMPHTIGVLVETTIGSVVEIILFMVLLVDGQIHVIQAAILGSILATMLLCLGLCFFASGLRREESTFDEVITEAGSGLLLTAGVGLVIPTVFEYSLTNSGQLTTDQLKDRVLSISHGVAILLLVAYIVYIFFQVRTHHGILNAIFEFDEERDHDRHKEAARDKLTLTECFVALAISVTLVAITAYILVQEIEPLVEEKRVSDAFLGLILVPLVEKAAEHLTAIDEAWDNQMNFALSHCVGSTLQTALLNTPLVVLVGWNKEMSLSFEIFDIVMLILAIITVGNFLRDQKTNYLEGYLCVTVYAAIATAAFFYPDPVAAETGEH